MTDTERKALVGVMKDQVESWEFEDPREAWWKWQHQYARAADQIEADGQRIAELEVGISRQEILDDCDQHKRIAELTGIAGQLKADNERLREALIHTAGICNPASGFLKNTTGLRKKHVENVQAIALAALGGKTDG